MNRPASIAVYLAPDDPYAFEYCEILAYGGFPIVQVDDFKAGELAPHNVLLLCGRGELTAAQRKILADWISNTGGSVVVSGSTWGLEYLLSLTVNPPTRQRCWAKPVDTNDRLWPKGAPDVHALLPLNLGLNGATAAVVDELGQPLVTRNRVGILVGCHLGALQKIYTLGRAVESEAVPAWDGTGGDLAGLPQAIDGTALSFETDRDQPEGAPVPYFARPHVDVWREIYLRSVVEAVEKAKAMVAIPWYWPQGADSCAAISVDCDDLDLESLLILVSSLQRYSMPATWMVPVPGLPLDAYRALRKLGHEIGLLFRGQDHTFNVDNIRVQQQQIARGSGSNVISTRNHGSYWHRHRLFYEMISASGLGYSVAKGGTSAGSAGFPFGTCHPFLAYPASLRRMAVFEMPYVLHQLGDENSDRLLDAIFETVANMGGLMHVAQRTSQASCERRETATQEFFIRVRQHKMLLVNLDDINKFMQARRTLKQRYLSNKLILTNDNEVKGLAIMVNDVELAADSENGTMSGTVVERYGVKWKQFVIDMERKDNFDLSFRASPIAA